MPIVAGISLHNQDVGFLFSYYLLIDFACLSMFKMKIYFNIQGSSTSMVHEVVLGWRGKYYFVEECGQIEER